MTANARTSDAVLGPSRGFVIGLVSALGFCVLLGLWVGRGGVLDLRGESVLLGLRAYRVGVALACGGGLAVAGTVVQTLFRNPLASPSILGTTSGAVLGAHAALLLSVLVFGGGGVFGVAPEMLLPLGAILGAAASLFVLLAVVARYAEPLALLLTGFALLSLFQGASSFLGSLTQEAWELQRAFAALSQGDISSVGPRQLWLSAVLSLGGLLPVWLRASTLDVWLTGDDEARTLGVAVGQARVWLVLWVAVLTAGAVAVGGSVGFVGLIVPHALRPWVGERHRYLIPMAFLAGGGFVVLCDVLCRVLPIKNGLPLGVLTDLIGAPVFLYLLVKQLRTQAQHA